MAKTLLQINQIEKIATKALLDAFIEAGVIGQDRFVQDVQTLLNYIDTGKNISTAIQDIIKANPDWSETNVTTSCKVIASRIASIIKTSPDWSETGHAPTCKAVSDYVTQQIGGITGAMINKGAWSTAPATGIKNGWLYNVTVATTLGAETLEIGDTLIANKDNASKTVLADWVIIQGNLTNSVTSPNNLTLNRIVVGSGGKTVKESTFSGIPKINNGIISLATKSDFGLLLERTEKEVSEAGATIDMGVAVANIQGKLLVYRNGAIQSEGATNDYTHTDTILTFSIPLKVGEKIIITYLS